MSQSVNNLKGAIAVITGGTSGIGLAVARELVASGIKGLVVSSRTQARIDAAVEELSALNSDVDVKGKSADAYEWDDMVALMEYTQNTFGQIDYVFVNAAGPELKNPVFDKLEKPDMSEAMRMVNSVAFTVHAATPFLAKSPSNDRAIIITGSDAAFNGFDIVTNYTIAKSALNGLTFSYVDLLRPHGIRINLVAMGYVLTGLTNFQRDSGGLKDSDFIPMHVVTSAYLRLVNDSTKSGVVTRIPHPHSIPFDVQAETSDNAKWSFWEPILAKYMAEQASSAPQ